MKIPASLAQRIELYRGTGRVRPQAGELFTDLSWFYIFEGMGVRPDSHDPLMDTVTKQQLSEILAGMARATRAAVDGAPSHDSHFAMTSPVPGAKSPGAVMP
jgi:tryptophan halogenase